jgi:hypothetical protein
MMGERRMMQEALFYGFSLERHVPDGYLLRKIDRFVDLSEVRAHLRPYYSDVGRPSIDPEWRRRVLRPSGNPPALKSPPKRRVTVSFMTTKPARLTAERSPAQDGRETMRGANERLVGGDRDQRSSGVRT